MRRSDCELYLGCSPFNLEDFRKRGVDPERVAAVLPPFHKRRRAARLARPTREGSARASDGAPELLMVGRIAPNKGDLALIDALTVCRRDVRSAHALAAHRQARSEPRALRRRRARAHARDGRRIGVHRDRRCQLVRASRRVRRRRCPRDAERARRLLRADRRGDCTRQPIVAFGSRRSHGRSATRASSGTSPIRISSRCRSCASTRISCCGEMLRELGRARYRDAVLPGCAREESGNCVRQVCRMKAALLLPVCATRMRSAPTCSACSTALNAHGVETSHLLRRSEDVGKPTHPVSDRRVSRAAPDDLVIYHFSFGWPPALELLRSLDAGASCAITTSRRRISSKAIRREYVDACEPRSRRNRTARGARLRALSRRIRRSTSKTFADAGVDGSRARPCCRRSTASSALLDARSRSRAARPLSQRREHLAEVGGSRRTRAISISSMRSRRTRRFDARRAAHPDRQDRRASSRSTQMRARAHRAARPRRSRVHVPQSTSTTAQLKAAYLIAATWSALSGMKASAFRSSRRWRSARRSSRAQPAPLPETAGDAGTPLARNRPAISMRHPRARVRTMPVCMALCSERGIARYRRRIFAPALSARASSRCWALAR